MKKTSRDIYPRNIPIEFEKIIRLTGVDGRADRQTIGPVDLKSTKKSIGDSGNYMAIALGSIIGKILDNVIIFKCLFPPPQIVFFCV